MTKEETLNCARQFLAGVPDVDEKLRVLEQHADVFFPLFRCFILGFDLKTVSEYMQKPRKAQEIQNWMLDTLAVRMSEPKVKKMIEDLENEIDATERRMQNMQKTLEQKDQVIRRLQEKIDAAKDLPDRTEARADERAQKNHALEAFKADVLVNRDFSSEQKKYLLSLLEKGENYSDIAMLAEPAMSLEEMIRFHDLLHAGEKRKIIDGIRKFFMHKSPKSSSLKIF